VEFGWHTPDRVAVEVVDGGLIGGLKGAGISCGAA